MTDRRGLSERYMAGESLLDLHRATGLAVGTIRHVIMDDGVEMRPRGRAQGIRRFILTDRELAVITRYRANETMASIGEFYGVSRERVRQILARCGEPKRQPTPKPKPNHQRRDDGRYVYFAVAVCGLVKIGSSIAPKQRLCDISEWVPFEVNLAATTPGSYELEAAIHSMFADEWMFGEWFKISDRLEQFMIRVASGLPFEIAPGPAYTPKNTAITQKKRASHRVTHAEKRAGIDSWRGREGRPAYLIAAMESFAGNVAPPPSPEALAAIDRYLAELASAEARTPAERAA